MQLGFDLAYTDPVTQQEVPWGKPDAALVARIRDARWKVIDVETTGLNPASKEQSFSGRDLRRGVRSDLRLRVFSVLYPLAGTAKGYDVVSFDFDHCTEAERREVAAAGLSNVVIAHNAGFDAYWARLHAKVTPTKLLDTMLIARVLAAEHPLVMARMCNDENEDPDLRAEAEMMFKSGRAGWSLADLAVGRLRKILPKDMQGPKNWCEPFLTQRAYDYALDDVIHTYELLMSLLEIDDIDDLLPRYEELLAQTPALQIVEPQVMDIIRMREHGMPWSMEESERYVLAQWDKVSGFANQLVQLEPSLARFERALAEPEKGITSDLKQVIGEAFSRRGLELEVTDAKGEFKIGEKDLRRFKAQVNPEAAALFDIWVGLNRAKKAGGMAKEVSRYAAVSGDGRIHSNTGHGPVTGRLASSEPNVQQFPRDQGFRNCVTAREGYKILASDYSALDMRVGGALAIRAQRQIFEAYMGDRACKPEVLRIIQRVIERKVALPAAIAIEQKANAAFEAWKSQREMVADDGSARKQYWDRYRALAREQLLAGFQRCFVQCRERADADDTGDWGALRDAFSINGMDIHTWTALEMKGQAPKKLFHGLNDAEVSAALKKWKKELGDVRQTGKVGNLSLLYAMKTKGLMDAAAKNYNIHWTYEEADAVRVGWLGSYVEIDLWHKWTELNPVDSVFVPDPDRGMRYTKKDVYASHTLGGRLIYAFGLNAALSYEDQSTGADILGRVMQTLREQHPPVFETVVNQVHDELVFEVPSERIEAYTPLISDVMTECAEYFLMPYGVRAECSPAVGDVWLKD